MKSRTKNSLMKVRNQTIDNNSFQASGHLVDAETNLINYNHSIISSIFETIKIESDTKILEFSAGLGTLTEIVRNRYGTTPVCVEIDENFLEILRSRGFNSFQTLQDLPSCNYEIIFSSNVLEHIDNDSQILRELKEKLAPDSHLALYVPALKFLYSSHDREIGHFRRYGRAELKQKLEHAGFEI